MNSTGQAIENVMLTLTDAAQAVPGGITMGARADADGRFRLANVPPGSYRLIARAAGAQPGTGRRPHPGAGAVRRPRRAAVRSSINGIRLWGSVDVPVDGRNLTNVLVTLQQGLTVSGASVFKAPRLSRPISPGSASISHPPIRRRGPAAREPGRHGRRLRQIHDRQRRPRLLPVDRGRRRHRLVDRVGDHRRPGHARLSVRSEARQRAVGRPDTFTDKQAQLTGTITNQRGQPAPEQTLILYPADERYWIPQSRRIRSTRPATDGQFTFAGIPPGDYKIVAMVDVETGAWFDPAFLQQIDAASTRVTIGDGEKKVQNLQISTGRCCPSPFSPTLGIGSRAPGHRTACRA